MVQPSGRAPETKKAKVASCAGTRQKPGLDARFELLWGVQAPGALFYQIQAEIPYVSTQAPCLAIFTQKVAHPLALP